MIPKEPFTSLQLLHFVQCEIGFSALKHSYFNLLITMVTV